RHGTAACKAHFALQAAVPCLCIAPIPDKKQNNRTEPKTMRAETLNIVDEIRQAITLLRRHL
ncbi:hypothetical protein, partial [Mesorhizobium sp. M1E.F.Ca.ET.041.01.1.1]|uniref:hypothetical protein n=1 Tax=Mesorhizobium sp. M1E.F.Ca.ET.041.01.1.1 TaxID=2496759 RepID=UPI001AECB7E7